jgi:hypothetical protein
VLAGGAATVEIDTTVHGKEHTMYHFNSGRLTRLAATGAMVVGLGAGSYGIASAASGTGTSTTSTTSTPPATGAQGAPPGATAANPWGNQRSDETLLTGDALAKVKAIALAKVSGGTIVRVETDADGVAAYEAHMTNADGSPVTVYVDKNFNFVSVK